MSDAMWFLAACAVAVGLGAGISTGSGVALARRVGGLQQSTRLRNGFRRWGGSK